jgi:3-deoxy-D-manno-octulosonic-acid transferase
MILLYNLLWPLGLLFFLPAFFLKMFRRGGYRKNFGQRLGFYGGELRRRLQLQRPIWIHAVSVGEVMIALKLAAKLRLRQPSWHCVLTTTTATGYALAQKSPPEWMTVLYAPLDFWPVMLLAFRAISPLKIVLIEAEVWPNMVTQAVRQNIPIALVNARLSNRSERRFRRLRFLLAPIFRKLSLFCVAEPQDLSRWEGIGAPAGRIQIVGNIKFDTEEMRTTSHEPRRFLEELEIDSTRPVIFGGSTHRGEEEILADSFITLRQEFAGLFLVIAPRHVERTGEIESLLRRHGLRVARRTTPLHESAPDVLLIDTTGELADWYHIATVVFIGKSMTAHGGQNPVEAITAGKPVIFGPYMDNFAALCKQLLKQNAAMCARDRKELAMSVQRLLSEPLLRESMIAQAARVLAPNRGATVRTADFIDALG